ncbi:MAG: hypothetical protein JWO06_1635 [Bacteroidota bacterium]|nr:hypothetical protein [Bacteroidota bacterium]
MKTTIGVYDTHEEALDAIRELKETGFPADKISLLGKAEMIKNHIHINPRQAVEGAEISVGVVAGSVLGVLTGVGIFAIPGLGFLFGAGALVGAFAGLEFGVLGGGVVAILTGILEIDHSDASKYEAELNEGKFLVIVQGNEDQVKHAKQALQVPQSRTESVTVS